MNYWIGQREPGMDRLIKCRVTYCGMEEFHWVKIFEF